MGLFSSSKSSATTNITDNRWGVGGNNNAPIATDNATLITTDHGAIAIGGELTSRALFSAERNNERAINANARVAHASINAVQETAKDAFGFGGRALDTVDSSLNDILGFAKGVNSTASERVSGANKSLLDFGNSALNFAERSTRSDTQQSFNSLIQTAGVVAAVYFLSKAI